MVDEADQRLVATARVISVRPPFDLARTAAPVWWARGRWPNVDWREGALWWVGWEQGQVVWRSLRQHDEATLVITGTASPATDVLWSSRALGTDDSMPEFAEPLLATLAGRHRGMRPWAAGSLFEGVVSSIVGQSISIAAAATTESRLFALFNPSIQVEGREFWPPPLPSQLAQAQPARVRASGVTMRRAQALVEIGARFAHGEILDIGDPGFAAAAEAHKLLITPGVGPWTVQSALLWGIAAPDAHPVGDVALLRAVRKHYPHVSQVQGVTRMSEAWAPHRAWAARLLWLDLLGCAGGSGDEREGRGAG